MDSGMDPLLEDVPTDDGPSALASATAAGSGDAAPPVTPLARRKSSGKAKRKSSAHSEEISAAPDTSDLQMVLEELFDVDQGIESQGGFFTHAALVRLIKELDRARKARKLSAVSVEQLQQILRLLDPTILKSTTLRLDLDEAREENDDIHTALLACKAALLVMTAPDMPKQVFLEEVIEHMVEGSKAQLNHGVYGFIDASLANKSDEAMIKETPKEKGRRRSTAARAADKAAGSAIPAAVVTQANKIITVLGEVFELFADLILAQPLQDTTVVSLTDLGLSPIFKEGTKTLQHKSLLITRSVFLCYPSHRASLIDDLLSSLDRLSVATKKSLQYYAIGHNRSLLMVNALLLQILQCGVARRATWARRSGPEGSQGGPGEPAVAAVGASTLDQEEAAICDSYNDMDRTANGIITKLLERLRKKNENDSKTLMGFFVKDLVTTLYDPLYPSSELLLFHLTKSLMKVIHSAGTKDKAREGDITLRHYAVEVLGEIAAAIRSTILSKAPAASTAAGPSVLDDQDTLLRYLDGTRDEDEQVLHAKKFSLALWMRDEYMQIRAALRHATAAASADPASSAAAAAAAAAAVAMDEDEDAPAATTTVRRVEDMQERCSVLARHFNAHAPAAARSSSSYRQGGEDEDAGGALGWDAALAVSVRLGSKRALSRDLSNIIPYLLAALKEGDSRLRSRALKALGTLLEADGSLLDDDILASIRGRTIDIKSSVREAAVEVIGRLMSMQPENLASYYDLVKDRILDNGVSVRKRIIRILCDVLDRAPHFDKASEIIARLLGRVSDPEASVQDCALAFLSKIWFNNTGAGAASGSRKPSAEVLSAYRARGLQLIKVFRDCEGQPEIKRNFEALLRKMLEGDGDHTEVLASCQGIVNFLVEYLVELDTAGGSSSTSSGAAPGDAQPPAAKKGKNAPAAPAASAAAAAAMTSDGGMSPDVPCAMAILQLFCAAHPPLLVAHSSTLQPYIQTPFKGLPPAQQAHAYEVILQSTRITHDVLPLAKAQSSTEGKQLEETLVKLIFSGPRSVLEAAAACLGRSVQYQSRNTRVAMDSLERFYTYLKKESEGLNTGAFEARMPDIRRALVAMGLLSRYVEEEQAEEVVGSIGAYTLQMHIVRDVVFLIFVHFASDKYPVDIRLRAIEGLGHFFIRHPIFMLHKKNTPIYFDTLRPECKEHALKTQILRNLQMYLACEEDRFIQAEKDKAAARDAATDAAANVNLHEINGEDSGVSASLMSLLEEPIKYALLSDDLPLRTSAMQVMSFILRQGLTNPMNAVSYLIALGVDTDSTLREQSRQLLNTMDDKHHSFILQKAAEGALFSYNFRAVLLNSEVVDGYSETMLQGDDRPSRDALLAHLYTLLQRNKEQRRAFLLQVLESALQKDVNVPLAAYMLENLAYLPYKTFDEPLFIINNIEARTALEGAEMDVEFREILGLQQYEVEDDASNLETVAARIPNPVTPKYLSLHERSRRFALYLILKDFLVQRFRIAEARVSEYSPTAFDRSNDAALPQPSETVFNKAVLIGQSNVRSRMAFARQYVLFQHLLHDGSTAVIDSGLFPEDQSASGPAAAGAQHQGSGGTGARPETPVSEARALKKEKSTEKRKAAFGRTKSGGGGSAAGEPKEKKARKRGKKRVVTGAGDSEEGTDPEDEDFMV